MVPTLLIPVKEGAKVDGANRPITGLVGQNVPPSAMAMRGLGSGFAATPRFHVCKAISWQRSALCPLGAAELLELKTVQKSPCTFCTHETENAVYVEVTILLTMPWL